MIPHRVTYVDTEIAEFDGMMSAGGHKHYFSVGSCALTIIYSVMALAGKESLGTILDFGCGAGRVTRWLRAAFPDSTISASDLREGDLAFVRERYGAITWVSGTDPDIMQQLSRFDLIWVGSVITHLEPTKTKQLINKLFEWLNPGGLLVVSSHGRKALAIGNARKLNYVGDWDLWDKIVAGYEATGYGYSDYPGQKGYGISLIAQEWLINFTKNIPNSCIVLIGEELWDAHHDIVALRKL